MRKQQWVPSGIVLTLFLTGCGLFSSSSENAYPVARFSGTTLLSAELKKELEKNSPGTLSDTGLTDQGIRAFANRYIDYRLKVADGYSKGFGDDSLLNDEFNSYKRNLAQARVMDGKVKKALIEELYQRKQMLVKASHILVSYNEAKNGPDTVDFYVRAMNFKAEIEKGKNFNQAAKEFSDEPNAKQTGGDLGWFSGGDMVYPFENAVFTAPLKKVYGPVRTQFGYHLIWVEDRKVSPDPRFISHIMLMFGQGKDTVAMKTTIDSVSGAISKSQDKVKKFHELVMKYSEDTQSKINNGSMGEWRPSGRVPEFDTTIYSFLKKAGEISGPVRTKWGYHIVLLDSVKTKPTLDSQMETLSRLVSRQSERMNSQKTLLFSELTEKNKIKITQSILDSLSDRLTYVINQPVMDSVPGPKVTAEILAPFKNRVLISSVNGSLSVAQFNEFANKNGIDQKVMKSRKTNDKMISQMVSDFYLDHYISHLDEFDPEFVGIMKSFKDGLVLFKWMETQIWQPAEPSDADLQPIFAEKKGEFNWEERGEFIVLSVNNYKMADSLIKVHEISVPKPTAKKEKKGKKQEFETIKTSIPANWAELESVLRKNNILISADTVVVAKGDGEKASQLWARKVSQFDLSISYLDGRPSFVLFNKVIPAGPKSFEEAKPELSRIYNERLIKTREEQLITDLRKKAGVEIEEKGITRFIQENKKK